MRIIPQNFKQRTKFLKNQLQKKENIKISSTKFNDVMARSYGWLHYHEMKIKMDKCEKSLFSLFHNYSLIEEYNLTIEQEQALINKKISEISIFYIDILGINETSKRELEKLLINLHHFIYPFIAHGLIQKKENRVKQKAFPLNENNLRIHSLISTDNYKERVNYTLSLIRDRKNGKLSIKNSIWIINTSEFESLSEHISFLKDNNHIVETTILSNDLEVSIDLKNIQKHHFLVYPDNYNPKFDNFKSTPLSIISDLKDSVNKLLVDSINEDSLRDSKPIRINGNLILYVNSDISDLPISYGVFVAQARSFGIASIIATKSRDYFVSNENQKETKYTIIANSSTHIVNIKERLSIKMILGNLEDEKVNKIKNYISKNKEITAIAMLSIDFNADISDSLVFLNKNGEVHSLIEKAVL
jgi:hypothetical protein